MSYCGRPACYYSNTNQKKKTVSQKVSLTLLFVSQRLTYDTKVEKDIFDLVSFRSAQKISNLGFENTFFFRI
jgi:hypothetical protein